VRQILSTSAESRQGTWGFAALRSSLTSEKKYLVWIWALLVPILNWPATAVPFERDEGEYLLAATINGHGGLAYRDVFIQKPPGIILVYRALLALTDGSSQSIHIALLFVYTLTAIGIGAIAWKLAERTSVAALSIVLYAMSISTPLYQASAANTEAFMVAGIVLSTYSLLKARETQRLRWVILLGLALGAAGMMKQTAAPHVLWLIPALAFAAPTRKHRLLWPFVALIASASVVLLVCAPYFIGGAGKQMLDGVIYHNLEYSRAQLEKAFYDKIGEGGLDVDPFHIALWVCAFAGFVTLAVQRRWWAFAMLGGWSLTAWIGVSAGALMRGHYLIQLIPPVVILAAFSFAVAPRPTRKGAAAVVILLWIVAFGFQWFSSSVSLSDQRYHTHFFEDAVLVGRYIRNQSDRSLYVFGSEAEIYYYAGTKPITRYVISNPLFGGFQSSPARQREVWEAIRGARPKWIVTVSPTRTIPFFPGSDSWLFDRVNSLLREAYTQRTATLLRAKPALLPVEMIPRGEARNMTLWERNDSARTQ
jgi:hypothetical protein